MARLPLTANAGDNTEGLTDFTPIPAGDVIAAIKTSQYKKTKAGDGHYLQLIWTVSSPKKYKSRTLFDNLNLDNPNPIAEEIANKALNSICQACDKIGVQDSEELHGIPCKLTLKVDPGNKNNPPSNCITAYKKVSSADAITEEESKPAVEWNEKDGIVDNTSDETPVVASKKLPWEE